MAISVGTRLGPYEILSQIGAGGGMGEVYKARDTRLNRIVAIKVLPQHLSDRPELRERFEREARAIAVLNHPHICTLHDIGRVEIEESQIADGRHSVPRPQGAAGGIERLAQSQIENRRSQIAEVLTRPDIPSRAKVANRRIADRRSEPGA